MNLIRPFYGLRYNEKKIKLDKVICPPYDVINQSNQHLWQKNSSVNAIYLSYNLNHSSQNKYKSVHQRLTSWKKRKILITDPNRAYYFLQENFQFESTWHTRRGLFAWVSVLDNPWVIPHEKFFNRYVNDRLVLLNATKTHVSPILMTVEDKKHRFESHLEALAKSLDVNRFRYPTDGIDYQMGTISDDQGVMQISDLLKNQKLMIADGHHRFETARRFAVKTKKDVGILAFLTPGSSSLVKSIHRALHTKIKIEDFENKIQNTFVCKKVFKRYEIQQGHVVWVHPSGQLWQVSSKKTKHVTSVEFLHHELIPQFLKLGKTIDVRLTSDEDDLCLQAEQKNTYGFLLPPLNPSAIVKACQNGNLLPQKSTFFVPKVMTGIVMKEF